MKLSVNRIRTAALALGLSAAALLASCGGGDPVVPFEPTRVLAFGDENSVITTEGRKYTVNGLKEVGGTKVLDCTVNPIWVQILAAGYGLVFPQCNASNVSDPRSRIYAVPDAKVADVVAQVDQHLATDTFSNQDLVTLFAGQHDVFEQYALYPGVPVETLGAELRRRGELLSAQASRIAAAGGKVLVSTVLNLEFTPFALNENVVTGDPLRSNVIFQLSQKFNEGVRVGLQGESGSQIAIMLTSELVENLIELKESGGGTLLNVKDPVCDVTEAPSVELCTTDTLVTDGDANTYLWADDTHLSPNGHSQVGALAGSRTRTNPF